MITNQIFRLTSTMSLVRSSQFIPLFTRFGSTLFKQAPSNQNKSPSKDSSGKSQSEYLAADMYDYTTFSYYDIEASMIKYRLPQPSSYAPSKPELAAQKK